jgi:hypothetical protein
MMESKMEVASGKIHVRFFPWITISPGSRPRGRLMRDPRYNKPPKTRKMTPAIKKILANEVNMGLLYVKVVFPQS